MKQRRMKQRRASMGRAGRGGQRRNCSLPMSPIFFIPRRCAEAITIATLSYLTSLLGRRCTSGCSGISAAARSRASSSWRSCRTRPFQIRVPSKSTSMVTTSGGTGGGGGVPTGMFSLTACVWMGIVMMSMMSRTSITSINGVVLMSTMTSGSLVLPPLPIFMAMSVSPLPRAGPRRRLRDETDLEDAHALAREHHPADGFVACFLVAANVDFRLRLPHRDFSQPGEQHPFLGDELVVPEHVAVLVDGDDDVLGLGLRRQISFLRKLDWHALDDHRDRDEEDDQQYEHHVHERGRVDIRDEIVFGVRVGDVHAHDSESLRMRPPRPSSNISTPPPKCRMSSIAPLLRRTSQL